MIIEVPPQLETAVIEQASARGISPLICVLEVLERNFRKSGDAVPKRLKNSYGVLAKYGPAPTAEDINDIREDMLCNSIFARDVE